MRLFRPSILIAFMLFSTIISAQVLPIGLTEAEKALEYQPPQAVGFTTPPASPVRTPAEWEEIDGLCVRWEGTWSRSVLRNIVKEAKEQCTVYIVTQNQNSVISHLNSYGINQNNIVFVNEPSNSIWFRDYGQWNVYTHDVDSLLWVDWIYNRPRPYDDVLPVALSNMLDIPLYQTLNAPYDIVNTGGNFMVDGFGTAFASELILEENDGTGYGISNHSEAAVDQIMNQFMGIERYIKMPTLPYDGIHHIDMHMKLLDEETLLIGQYPNGVADGPQIESNLNYVLNNFNSVFGTAYKIIRVPMPPEGGQYPNQNGDYRTYTNSVFVNKTILVPTYEEQWDSTALRIYREALPGYKVVGIDCNEIITASGAIHCITKAVSSSDPLLISHQPLPDVAYTQNDYEVNALIKHADGISNATVFWSVDTTAGYNTVAMTLTDPQNDTWTGYIPFQAAGQQVFYHIHAEANNGKQQVRPITAPLGYWEFRVLQDITGIAEVDLNVSVYPNPSSGNFSVSTRVVKNLSYSVLNMTGKLVSTGNTQNGRINLDLTGQSDGLYLLQLNWEGGSAVEKLKLTH